MAVQLRQRSQTAQFFERGYHLHRLSYATSNRHNRSSGRQSAAILPQAPRSYNSSLASGNVQHGWFSFPDGYLLEWGSQNCGGAAIARPGSRFSWHDTGQHQSRRRTWSAAAMVSGT